MSGSPVAPEAGLELPRALADELVASALGALPEEACGIVSGPRGTRRADSFHPARNADASPLRYTLDPADQVRITLALDAAGSDVLAIFHSHPSSPGVPSPADVRQATHPDAAYLILGLGNGAPELRAWRLSEGRATEIRLSIG